MEYLTTEIKRENLVIADEMINNDNAQVDTGIIDGVDDEIICSDVNEAENANGDDTEHEIVNNDNVEDSYFNEKEIAASDTGEDGNISDYDTEQSGNNDRTSPEIVGSNLTEPDTDNNDNSDAEITSDEKEKETASSENAGTEAADEEIATGNSTEAETSISDDPENTKRKGGVFVPVFDDKGELLGYEEVKFPYSYEDQNATEDKVAGSETEELHDEDKADSRILEGRESSLDVSEDKDESLERTKQEQEQALQHMGGEDSTEVENDSNDSAEFSLPEGVTEEPRNEEEMHIGIIRDNPSLIQTYLQVSDDKGELFRDEELDQKKKDFCDRCANPEEIATQDFDKLIEEGIDIASQLTRKVNMLENGMAGIFTKRRIEDAEFFIELKKLVTTKYGPVWEAWFKINFQGSEFRTVQDYMSLAKIPGIKRYSVFGKERLLRIKRQLTDADMQTSDPVGTFIKENGIDFNPQIQTDDKALNVETDIAINHQRCLKAGLDIPKENIEALVRLGKEVEPKHIKELQIRKDANQDIVVEFKKMIAAGGKLEPTQTSERKAENFNKSTVQFIKKVESAILDHEYLGTFKANLITKLKEKVQQLEEMLQTITEDATEPPSDETDSSQVPARGGN